MDYDIIVVGCGVAGLSAAMRATEEGAKVGVLERSAKDMRGGNSRYTEAFLRIKPAGDGVQILDDFEEELTKATLEVAIDPEFVETTVRPYKQWPRMLRSFGFTDPELISSFAEDVPKAIAWLTGFGVKVIPSWPYLGEPQRMAPSGGGLVVVENLASAAEKSGVTFHYETTARSLIQNKRGEVRGVSVWSESEGMQEFKSKAVVLASGGFQGNLEMMTKYFGKNSHFIRPVALGGLHNKGEGIAMALRIGAAPAGQYDRFHAEAVDPRSGLTEAYVGVYPYGILVNKSGERFIDEAYDLLALIFEEISLAIVRQPGGIAYIIYDSKMEDVPNYTKLIKSDKEPIRAKSIKELASKVMIDPAGLEKTIKDYNAAVQDGKFDPSILDGKCTKGIQPEKSNWARSINENDLICYPLRTSNCFTLGGLKVTPNAEVVNLDGCIIPGLYAAGEVIGLYYGGYVGATSFLKGLVFGRKAGENAAQLISSS
jgi:tricarballylate dehydrogenase